MALLGICFDLPDLCAMGPPLLLNVIHLEKNGLDIDEEPCDQLGSSCGGCTPTHALCLGSLEL